jgi:hypothetical protein
MAQFLASEHDKHGDKTVDLLRDEVSRMVRINPKKKPTRLQIAALAPWTDLKVSHQSTSDWYCLLRLAQGDLREQITARYFDPSDEGFVLDGLFCEYAYIINLDTQVMEFYTGFIKLEDVVGTPPGRYWQRLSEVIADDEDARFGPIVLADEIPFKLCFDQKKHASLVKRMDKAARAIRRLVAPAKKKKAPAVAPWRFSP